MARYHRLSQADKARYALERMREPPVHCPTCETGTTPDELLEHVARCPGRREPHMAARWGSWRDLKALGVPRATLHGWLRRGAVRSEGPAGERKYLMRDVVERFANTKRRAETGNPLDVSRASRITESNMHKVAGDTYLSVSAVARALGLSAARVRQLDEDLAPLKLERGQRVYLKSNVDRLARQRSRDKK